MNNQNSVTLSPMHFRDFLGNPATVHALRAGIASSRVPQSIILAGPRGSGKYTLALLFIQALNCLAPLEVDGLPDPCGTCSNCQRIGEAANLEERVAAAVNARDDLRDADKRETRILIQTHPDILIIPPDPPQLLIKVGQVRQVIHAAYYRPPAEARRAVFLFTSSSFMKEAANSLLKVLEEPPPNATILILSDKPGELLPTIRSRCQTYLLGALPVTELEALLAERRKDWRQPQRMLVARLAEGAVGRALAFDLDAYLAARADAQLLLRTALRSPEFSPLFQATEKYRAGADGQEKTIALLRAFGSLLEDLLLLHSGTPQLVRNIDLLPELEKQAANINIDWLDRASYGLSKVESGMRRNLLRNLSLDAFASEIIRT
jgi:DNA polymerase-3 subunit delta'